MEHTVYQAQLLEPKFWSIEENGVRCFLVEGEREAMLVDTGFGTGDLKAFVQTLTSLPVFVVNTHADRDHIGCNGQFSPAWMHPADFDRCARSPQGKDLPLRPLWEDQVLELGQRRFEVILIPGHTPGSIVLWDEAHKTLISGDSVQAGNIYLFGPGRNLPALITSLEKLIARCTDIQTIFPSHGPLPLPGSTLPTLLQDARDLQSGKLTGTAPDRDVPGHLFCGKAAGFYYDGPIL